MLREFKYTKTGSDTLVSRKVFVLNEDASRIGGLELTGASDEAVNEVVSFFKDHAIGDFSRRPKGAPKPEYERKFDFPYKAFSKAKIAQYNP